MFDYNDFYNEYEVADSCKREKLIEELKVVLYFNYKVFFKTDRDSASDFFCVFFDKLVDAIKTYDKKRGSFFYYFYTVVKTEFCKFKKMCDEKNAYMKTVNKEVEFNQEKVFDPLSYAYSSDDKKNIFYTGEPSIQYNGKNVKQLTDVLDKTYANICYKVRKSKTLERLLIYRYANVLGEGKVSKLCDFFGLDKEEVFGNIIDINDSCRTRKQVIKCLNRKISKFYLKMRHSKKKLEYLCPDDYDYCKCLRLNKSYRKSWLLNRKMLAKISPLPSYKAISEVMDLDYGTTARYMRKISNVVEKASQRPS